MIRLERVSKRGPNVELGKALYQIARVLETNVPVVRLRLADHYNSGHYPIDLRVDTAGAELLIGQISRQLHSNDGNRAAEFLRRIADSLANTP